MEDLSPVEPIVQEELPPAPEVNETSEVEIDFAGYPDGPAPAPPFRLVEGDEYENNRRLANSANARLHNEDPSLDGLEIHEVKPVKFGGSPDDPGNKVFLTPEEHQQFTNFWNGELRRLNEEGKG
jgi:toxin YxiD